MTTNGAFPVQQQAVEQGLLGSVNQNMERWLQVASFTNEDFVAQRDVFQFFTSYLSQYGNLPSSSQISTRFNEWAPPIGDFAYWLAEMKRYALARRILEALTEGYQKITDPSIALSYLVEKLSLIRADQTNHIQATDASAGDRLDRFDYRTQNIFNAKQIIGIRTGLKIIDDSYIGYIPGSMVGCFARPGVGKTWWLLWSGANAWVDGHSVLAITPEMPASWLNMRIDVVLGGLLGHPIEYNKALIGDPSIRTEYELITKVLSQSQRWWTYDSIDNHSVSLGDLAALIRLHNPEVVLIDGVSLLRNETRGQTWEQMKDICYGIKNMATIYDVPILVTHQAVNSARGRRTEQETIGRGDDFLMPSLNDAAFGDAFVQACSDVITMCGDQHSRYINWYSIRKARERGFKVDLPPRLGLACDFERGIIKDLSDFGYSPEAVGAEARRILGR